MDPGPTTPSTATTCPSPISVCCSRSISGRTLAQRLRDAGVDFVIEPRVRFEGQAGEQRTMFLLDPAGNALEFKAFADDARVFAID